MPRRARLNAPGTLHHMMIRGIEGKGIFRDTLDPKDFVTGTRILPGRCWEPCSCIFSREYKIEMADIS